MQRLVSKAEESGGGTRQEWLDCLREIVEVGIRTESWGAVAPVSSSPWPHTMKACAVLSFDVTFKSISNGVNIGVNVNAISSFHLADASQPSVTTAGTPCIRM